MCACVCHDVTGVLRAFGHLVKDSVLWIIRLFILKGEPDMCVTLSEGLQQRREQRRSTASLTHRIDLFAHQKAGDQKFSGFPHIITFLFVYIRQILSAFSK